jgi:glycosyltransferase involved in cell wall biosynthesis
MSLIRALDDIAPEFEKLSLELLTLDYVAEQLQPRTLRVRSARAPGNVRAGARRVAAEQLAAARASVDLLHFFDLSLPLLRPTMPFVTTVHDAGPAHGHQRWRHAYKRFVHPWSLRRAAGVVAVSEFAREEAVRQLAADRNHIDVIHSGPGLTATWARPSARTGEHDFLLYVGDLTAHKNLVFLIDAFEEAQLDQGLLLVGRPGEQFREIRARVDAVTPPSRAEILEGVDDERLDGLYRQALATVLPSRYEGFGFTPLEAMARDCPVIASDIPAVREVLGDGALLLPLDSRDAWVDALRRVSKDVALRADLRERGRRVAGRYSWERAARQLCDLFERTAV